MSNIKMVVFDFAGTTVKDKSNVNNSFREVFLNHNIQVTFEDVNEVMGLAKPEAIEKVLKKYNLDLSNTKNIHNEFVRLMIDYYENSPEVEEIEKTSFVFDYLKKKNIKVSLDTGFSKDIASVIVKRMKWKENDLIDSFVCSDEVANARPYPDMIRYLMADLGVSDSKCVAKVGDSPADLLEGFNAGCGMNVGVLSGAFSKEELLQFDHTHIVDSVFDLTKLI